MTCFLFAYGARHRIIGVIRIAAILTLIGIIVNRLNISMIAYNWNVVDRYYPSWMEYVVSFTVIFAEIWVFRWIVTRMPVYEKHTKPAMAWYGKIDDAEANWTALDWRAHDEMIAFSARFEMKGKQNGILHIRQYLRNQGLGVPAADLLFGAVHFFGTLSCQPFAGKRASR